MLTFSISVFSIADTEKEENSSAKRSIGTEQTTDVINGREDFATYTYMTAVKVGVIISKI